MTPSPTTRLRRPLAFALALLATAASAQERPNAVMFELAGPGGIYSIGYERTVAPDVHVRAAVAYYYFLGAAPVAVLWTPEVGRGRLRPELGAGVVVGFSESSVLFRSAPGNEREFHVLSTASLGLRLGVAGVDLRAGATALYGAVRLTQRDLGIQPHLGLSARF